MDPFFIGRPECNAGMNIEPNGLVLARLLARINDPTVGPEELSSTLKGDASLSVTVLRWANSSLYGLGHAVRSVERAVVVIGSNTIRNWASVLVLARVGATSTQLLRTILVRARTCELLATALGIAEAAGYFTVGLFSAIDIILQVPMEQALDHLPLSVDQKAALRVRSGPLGAALDCVLAMESGDEPRARFLTLDFSAVARCYTSAIEWVDHWGSAAIAARPAHRRTPRVTRCTQREL